MGEAHASVVFDGGVDTSHHPLIVTKEEDGQGGNTVDGDEEVAFPQAVNDIEAVDLLHGESSGSLVTSERKGSRPAIDLKKTWSLRPPRSWRKMGLLWGRRRRKETRGGHSLCMFATTTDY